MPDYDLDDLGEYDELGAFGRSKDRAARKECNLPATGQEAPRQSGPTPAGLDSAFGIGQASTPAAQEQRIGRDSTWLK